MTSRVITFRLDTESEAGQIFEKWESKGYDARKIVEMALLGIESIEPPVLRTVGDVVVEELQRVVDRLEQISQNIRHNGGAITEQEQAEIEQTLNPDFVEGMKRIVQPAIRLSDNDA